MVAIRYGNTASQSGLSNTKSLISFPPQEGYFSKRQFFYDAVKQSLDDSCLYERQSHINRATWLVNKSKARLAKTTEQFQNRLHKAKPVISSMVIQGLTNLKRLLVAYKDLHPDFKVTVV